MPLMTWNNALSVNVAEIDQEHQKLVTMVNQLYDGILGGAGKDTLGKILDGLVAYTQSHFTHEEKLFDQTKYPDAAAHRKEHQDLTAQVLAVQEKYKSGATTALSMEVMNFLKNWLVNHIQGSDKRYSAHLNASGIK